MAPRQFRLRSLLVFCLVSGIAFAWIARTMNKLSALDQLRKFAVVTVPSNPAFPFPSQKPESLKQGLSTGIAVSFARIRYDPPLCKEVDETSFRSLELLASEIAHLDLDDVRVSDWRRIGKLVNIETLHIRLHEEPSDWKELEFIAKCSRLRTLRLEQRAGTLPWEAYSIGFAHYHCFPLLTQVETQHPTHDSWISLSKSKSLVEFRCGVKDTSDIVQLASFQSQLRKLYVFCHKPNIDIASLASMTSIEELELVGIMPPNLAPIACLPNLKKLRVDDTVSDSSLREHFMKLEDFCEEGAIPSQDP